MLSMGEGRSDGPPASPRMGTGGVSGGVPATVPAMRARNSGSWSFSCSLCAC